jgi:hypothetical protein
VSTLPAEPKPFKTAPLLSEISVTSSQGWGVGCGTFWQTTHCRGSRPRRGEGPVKAAFLGRESTSLDGAMWCWCVRHAAA